MSYKKEYDLSRQLHGSLGREARRILRVRVKECNWNYPFVEINGMCVVGFVVYSRMLENTCRNQRQSTMSYITINFCFNDKHDFPYCHYFYSYNIVVIEFFYFNLFQKSILQYNTTR